MVATANPLPVSTLATAFGAGLATSVLYASLKGGTALAVPLMALSGLPLVIMALGWGTMAGIVAAVVAMIATGLILGLPAVLSLACLTALPALVSAHQIGLARILDFGPPPAAADAAAPGLPVQGVKEWYPLGRVLAIGATLVAVATVALAVYAGFDPETILPTLSEAFLASMPDAQVGTEEARRQFEPLLRLILAVIPYLMPLTWTLILVFNLWLSAVVVRRSQRLARPWEDLSRVTVPEGLALVFGAAFLGSFLPGALGSIAAVFVGAYMAVYVLIGLAVLHVGTLGIGARGLILGMAYAVLFFFPFLALPLVLLGLLETQLRFRDRKLGGRRPPPMPPPPAG
jgi:hypothetical protein